MTQFLSEHFTLEEATFSQLASRAGIDNTKMAPEVFIAAQRTALRMEKVRLILGNTSIHVNSWIRCLELNRLLGSKDTSQHIKGEAVDFIAPKFGSPLAICREIVAHKDLIRFDQLILEHTWVHISFCSPNDIPRGQVLSLLKGGGYATGLTDANGVLYK
jgi:hypothetical protein